MQSLQDYVTASLQSEYAEVIPVSADVIRAQGPRDLERSTVKSVVVGVSSRPGGFGSGEAEAMAATLADVIARTAPGERYTVSAGGTAGIPAAVTTLLSDLGVTRAFPIQFFDRFYRSDENDTADVLRKYARLHAAWIGDERRVPQRYTANGQPGADLLADVRAALETPPRQATFRLVNAPAGAGKTVFFNAVFSALHTRFLDRKKVPKQTTEAAGADPCAASRPLFVTPEMLAEAQGFSLDTLLDALFETTGASPVSPPYFDWLLQNGHITLMLDGLDEFLARQNDVFERFVRILTAPGSRAQIILCTRDSLRATNTLLQDFLAHLERMAPGVAQVIDLAAFDDADRKRLVAIRFRQWSAEGADAFVRSESDGLVEDGRLAEPEIPAEIAAFDHAVLTQPAIAGIASKPYYLDLLVTQWVAHRTYGFDMPETATGLLAFACDELLAREEAKLEYREQAVGAEATDAEAGNPLDMLLNRQDLDDLAALVFRERQGLPAPGGGITLPGTADRLRRQKVLDLLAAAAHAQRRALAGTYAGLLDILDQRLSARLGSADSGAEARFRASLALKQIAFVRQGASGALDFTHEIMADFLAARHACRMLAANPKAIVEAIGDLDRPRDAIFDQALAEGLDELRNEDQDAHAAIVAALQATDATTPQHALLRTLI